MVDTGSFFCLEKWLVVLCIIFTKLPFTYPTSNPSNQSLLNDDSIGSLRVLGINCIDTSTSDRRVTQRGCEYPPPVDFSPTAFVSWSPSRGFRGRSSGGVPFDQCGDGPSHRYPNGWNDNWYRHTKHDQVQHWSHHWHRERGVDSIFVQWDR